MAGPVAALQQGETSGLPRNSSIDSAISAVSSKSSNANTSLDATPDAEGAAKLIKKAGSAEAVIQLLLKEKHSQAAQNNQLWRLVDKQRAMILGLNKDLERALKDKEKYRSKLKEVMANPAVAGVTETQGNSHKPQASSRPQLPRVDVARAKDHADMGLGSPTPDSSTHKHSPIDVSLAPYPYTPSTDQFSNQATLMGGAPSSMPRAQEHAYGQYDHDAEERAVDAARKQRSEEQLKEIPFSISLPPSRSLPSSPPAFPPPKPPTSPPAVSLTEPSPRPDGTFANFPTPPRKAPPAPLNLRPKLDPPPAREDDDSDSDIEGLLDIDEVVLEKRGRRRTRAEDDRVREIIATKEAEARSVSKKSKSGKVDTPPEDIPASPRTVPMGVHHEANTASLAAVLSGDRPQLRTQELTMPLRSPGLPASPRPMNMTSKAPLHSPPLSPRTMGSFPSAPLSPRPPRQPIPLPPNTPLATPAVTGLESMSSKPPAPSRKAPEPSQDSRSSPTDRPNERTQVYTGLTTEEYPDLLLPPNALPSVAINVASSRMKPSRASLVSLTQLEEDPVFTLAVISRADGGELWRIEKDSASLAKLDQRLKQCQSFTAKTPDRTLFSGHSPAKIDARRIALEQYMDELLNTPLDTATAVELCKYLSTNTLPPNADETGSSSCAAIEGSAHMIGPDGRPVRSGYLTKRGKNFGGWKSRFFLLDGPQLKYYETPGGAHLGTIKLQSAQIGKQSHQNESQSPTRAGNGEDLDQQYRHAFLILEPKKKDSSSHVKHVLCAESDRERDLWVDALLQWIDYRDPEDEEPASSSKAQAKPEKSSGKIRKANPPQKPYHAAADSDTLVGVRYGSTSAGDAPSSNSAERPKTSAGPTDANNEIQNSQAKVISGPKDPQPISDSAAWGNKPANAPNPSYEEKKARKRSFFGFGPKTRSSSEGHDSLSSAIESAAPQGQPQAPIRHVFGAQLAEAVKYNPPRDVNVPLPSVVYRCIQYLDSKDAILEEGIFRLSGSNVVIKQLRERFNVEGDINLITDEQFYDMHAVASLLKLYLRELPTTILSRDLHLEFLATTEITDRTEKIRALAELSTRLPLANATLLKYLISFLIKIINNADMNKMTVRNVGIVFSPTLNIPAPVFAMFLQNYEAIFGIDPTEYEPPFIAPDMPEHEMPRFEPPAPARPSTSSGSASPHRNPPRVDSMRDYQRSTPTPPLMAGLNAARGSPTPPLVARQGYEPTYSNQHYAPPQNGQRNPYETGYGAHAPPDSYNQQQHARAPAGYERQQYQSYNNLPSEQNNGNLGVQDQTQSSGRSRRESTMFMGNMMGPQYQGSSSRLREENRY